MSGKYRTRYIKSVFGVFIYAFVGILPVFSQNETQLTQYMFHGAMYNPASIGENGMINASFQSRKQWFGVEDAPVTFSVYANAPFTIGKNTHAAGLAVLKDVAGAFTNTSYNLQYAFKKKIGNGVLSAGASIGWMYLGIVASKLKNDSVNSDYHETDKDVPMADEAGGKIDLAAGLFYSAPKYYVGISYVHLNNPLLSLAGQSTVQVNGIAYLTGGYDISFEESKFMLKSSTLLKSDFRTWQADISSRLEYDKKYWGGLSYRFQDAVSVFLGFNMFNGVMAGVSYDIPTIPLYNIAKNGSLEFFVSYAFALDTSKNNNKYKSIRIL